MPAREPDDTIVPLFKLHAVKNDMKSLKEGRPIFDEMEIVEIRFPGSRAMSVFPATAFSHWSNDAESGEQTAVTYAERFAKQYRQFKEHGTQTKSGTPLAHAPFLSEGRRAEMRALNIYTVEQLASIDGQELKNLGSYGREFKNKAMEYIAESKVAAPNLQMAAELEALKARNAILEEDARALDERKQRDAPAAPGTEFDDMTLEQLREFITTNSGHPPHGSLGRKTLQRMAQDVKVKA